MASGSGFLYPQPEFCGYCGIDAYNLFYFNGMHEVFMGMIIFFFAKVL